MLDASYNLRRTKRKRKNTKKEHKSTNMIYKFKYSMAV